MSAYGKQELFAIQPDQFINNRHLLFNATFTDLFFLKI